MSTVRLSKRTMRKHAREAWLTAGIEPQTRCGACLTEAHQTRRSPTGGAIAAGWIALGATILSAAGYALQTLDHVSLPAHVAELVFFGVFEWNGALALLAGIIAVWTGWRRNTRAVWLGLVATSYVVLAQTAQSLWD
jgi:hypothetical protein